MDNRYVQQFKKGSLEMVLLCLIAKGETYGYEIITALNRQGGERPEILRFWNSLRAEISDLHLTFGEKSYKMFICP